VSIVFTVILGATLGLVPPIDFWLRITAPFFIHVSIIGLWLFIVCLPILFVTNLNVIWFGRVLQQRFVSTSDAIRTVLGVIMAAPLLIIAVYIYILVGHIFIWPAVILVLGPILCGFPLVYVLVIIGIMTPLVDCHSSLPARSPRTPITKGLFPVLPVRRALSDEHP
jgi:hypothetical protein